jgi:ABC-type multidrug transport system ATPase subunit
MDEAALCDRVALIQKGEILSINRPKGIIAGFKKSLWAAKAREMYDLMNAIKKDPAVESCYPFGQYHHITFKTTGTEKSILDRIIRNGSYTGAEIHPIEPNIEDCFMALMRDENGKDQSHHC